MDEDMRARQMVLAGAAWPLKRKGPLEIRSPARSQFVEPPVNKETDAPLRGSLSEVA
jgi:hypothetical protein